MLLTNAQAVAGVLRSDSDSEPSYSVLAALAATRTLALVVEDTTRALAAQARAAGVTWQEIGNVLGTSRQAAFQRFGPYVTQGDTAEMEHAVEDAGPRAVSTFTRWAERDWGLRSDFNDTMLERLSEEMLASAWTQVTCALGGFVELGEPRQQLLGGNTVVDVPMTFEKGEMKGRVAYDQDGKVAGLFILNPDVA